MNIYLDIDGVLLINETNLAPYADDFLQIVLKKYPESTYWLSTHCWNGENRAAKVVATYLKPETLSLISKVKPTDWGEMKTDAIDFTKPFLWFDDDLWPEEEQVLNDNNAKDSLVMVDLRKDINQLKYIIDKILV